jgi:POT family proton-dependent oligopeptide transporter
MAKTFRTTPGDSTTLPPGIPYIIGNEAAERFSFYGMKGILVVYMTSYMLAGDGSPDRMGKEQANGVYHLFTAAAYFFPLLGAIIADAFWGKYRTILVLSMGYCIGHGLIALGDIGLTTTVVSPRAWLFMGMVFIAIGSGGIKPCVSAHVGDQFGSKNRHLISRTFAWFYFSINVGAALSMVMAQPLLEHYGAWLAFGLPGVLMGIATFVFWLGRHHFVHIPPSGWAKFVSRTFNPDGRRAIRNLAPIFLIFIPVFWALFDQTGSSFIQQAKLLDLHFLGIDWYESQIQVANPILILLLIPTFSYLVYPFLGRYFRVTPLRKIGAGLFLMVIAFSIPIWIEYQLLAGAQPSIGWQLVSYVLLTTAEVMVSITALEFAYTQAPPAMKSLVMGIYLLGVSLGNLFTSGVNFLLDALKKEDGTTILEGPNYFIFFTGLMLVSAIAFSIYARTYRGSTFIGGVVDDDDLDLFEQEPLQD